MKDTKIGYLFADHGAEAEALAGYGDVIRVTIDPKPNGCCRETIRMDLSEETPDVSVDLALFHPPCTKWSDMPGVNTDDAPNLIPRAREIAHEIADEWIIENKPRAPLENPTLLNGRMFGLPIRYERAFETSFPVESPPRQQTLETETSPFYYTERSVEWWKAVKGVRGDYDHQHIAKNALPLSYVDFLVRSWLDATSRSETDVSYQTYDKDMETRRRKEANESLEAWE